ncbi:class I SAM-dependent methyltransferase [Nonomuraea sp. NPDC049400]|uniref:class I SAM-dependent methyltransferase n=1 Tax=Nonomuraea sp. NPDC049400 TaxID=3364352 RepID=UPI0037A40958
MQPFPPHNLTGWPQAQVERTFGVFYTTVRAGQAGLSDGGGPFGFDITVALLVDDLLSAFECDAIVETGCYLGDTTDYLAHRYPDLPVHACDITQAHVAFTRQRLAGLSNAHVTCLDSPLLVARANAAHQRTLFFLDAHWAPDWPLERELAAITRGVVLIHDFDVGHPRFGYDTYGDLVCGPQVLARMPDPPEVYFTPDPQADWPLPCLQTGRRAGVAVLAIGLDDEALCSHPCLTTRHLKEEVHR